MTHEEFLECANKIDDIASQEYGWLQLQSKLYTPPKPEYSEPIEDLYDWDTGKVRDE